MRLADLVAAVRAPGLLDDLVADHDDAEIIELTHDSRQVEPGWAFACIVGANHDGHDFAPAAVSRGASALICQRRIDLPVAQVTVPDVRLATPWLADALWGHPSGDLAVAGVTGTNGKTTVVHLLATVLEEAGRSTAVLGTLSGTRTTPESTDLQRWLAAQRDTGHDAVAMEVSSHGLALGRVDAMEFEVAVFTNLGHDHLDFHGDTESYFAAKASLFAAERTALGVVCRDDAHGRRLLAGEVAGGPRGLAPLVGYGIDDADDLVVTAAGCTFGWRGVKIGLPLVGRFNVVNALAAATAASGLGVDDQTIGRGLAGAPQVPGRFERVGEGDGPLVVVDYAHTPDALETALATAREVIASGRVIVVFGCGGDRDRDKRPAMGAVAERGADVVVLTSDNPRGESPSAIVADILDGMSRRPTVELDRRRAIAAGLAAAGAGDILLIAGKGHEATQTAGDTVIDFDDRLVVGELMA